MTTLIDTFELREALASSAPPRLLDVRWSLAQPDGRADFETAHIPGAVYVDLDTELADIGDPTRGRHPLPTREALQAAARRWGLNDGDEVVVYDAKESYGASRAWWLLRHAGVAHVRILDGGLAEWRVTGGEVASGAATVEPGSITLDWGRMPVIDADAAGEWPSHGFLLDARVPERFRGEVEPMDPVAGHIAGAINAPTAENLAEDGRFYGRGGLGERFADFGIDAGDEVAVYCGSGVTAAHEIAALEIAGFHAALYPGSWSEWSNQGRPAATGEQSYSRLGHPLPAERMPKAAARRQAAHEPTA
ncbi:sulfurtransferase [Demequina mangrovi]|uniref:Sulfurtransferase n=1 Tax=Demequina mangrovi TaxID=1043493 RepID=A0A1H6ZDZ2_9MICO|nr:sulfurtransferase [Demequina mangrovi]SEJ50344.1 thiosulfate/3-mercaptopyruvate sulfurtransferase [Demequina mangrovi]